MLIVEFLIVNQDNNVSRLQNRESLSQQSITEDCQFHQTLDMLQLQNTKTEMDHTMVIVNSIIVNSMDTQNKLIKEKDRALSELILIQILFNQLSL